MQSRAVVAKGIAIIACTLALSGCCHQGFLLHGDWSLGCEHLPWQCGKGGCDRCHHSGGGHHGQQQAPPQAPHGVSKFHPVPTRPAFSPRQSQIPTPHYEPVPTFAPQEPGTTENFDVPEEILPPLGAPEAPAKQAPDVLESPTPLESPTALEPETPAEPASRAISTPPMEVAPPMDVTPPTGAAPPMEVTPPVEETNSQSAVLRRSPSARYRSVRVAPRAQAEHQVAWQIESVVKQEKPGWRPTRRR